MREAEKSETAGKLCWRTVHGGKAWFWYLVGRIMIPCQAKKIKKEFAFITLTFSPTAVIGKAVG